MWHSEHDSNQYNLPVQLTAFIGRDKELDELDELLANSTCRLLTLCGPGGIGKTRLAIEVGNRNLAHFSDGVCFIDLEPLSSTDEITSTILTALGLQLQDGRDLDQQLQNYLSRKQILLILDNVEHLLDGVGLFTDLLESAPDLCILVTSREALKLREEWIRHIHGLDVPDDEQVSGLETYSAIQLFVEGAHRVQGDFSLVNEQTCVVRLCRIVEGLPLALELASSWLKLMPCSAIIEEIQNSLDLLESPMKNMPSRHKSMTAVFDQSWQLLSDEERAIFSKLSVFRGGFFRQAAEFVTGATLSTLSNLVDKSLLRVDGGARFHIHSLVRQYAEGKLRQSTEDYDTACNRHCQFYAEFLDERKIDVWKTESLEARNEISTELDNIRRAIDWAIDKHQTTSLEKAISPFTAYCYQRSLWTEGYTIFEQVADLARNLENDHILWQSLAFQGWFATCLGDFEYAAQLYEEALPAYRRSKWNNMPCNNFLILRLSEMALRQGDLEQARQYSVELAKDLSHGRSPVWILETNGRIEYLAGNYHQAKNILNDALTTLQQFPSIAGNVVISNHLGYVYLALGDYTSARQAFSNSIKHGRGFDYWREHVRSLIGLSYVAHNLNNNSDAWSYVLQALEKAWQIGNQLEVLNAITAIGYLLAVDGTVGHALELLAYCRNHPSADWEAHQKANQFLNTLKREVSTGVFAQAEQKAQTFNLHDIVERLLHEHNTDLSPNGNTGTRLSNQIDNAIQALPEPLTQREIEVLMLVNSGYSNRQIADQLVIGVTTVKKHITHIYGKLGVSSRTQAINRLRELQIS